MVGGAVGQQKDLRRGSETADDGTPRGRPLSVSQNKSNIDPEIWSTLGMAQSHRLHLLWQAPELAIDEDRVLLLDGDPDPGDEWSVSTADWLVKPQVATCAESLRPF